MSEDWNSLGIYPLEKQLLVIFYPDVWVRPENVTSVCSIFVTRTHGNDTFALRVAAPIVALSIPSTSLLKWLAAMTARQPSLCSVLAKGKATGSEMFELWLITLIMKQWVSYHCTRTYTSQHLSCQQRAKSQQP